MSKKKVSGDEFVQLTNGCYRSQFTVHPSNWNEAGADPSVVWYFSYRYYDPLYKNDPVIRGKKQVIVKGGVNKFSTLMAKRQVIKALLEAESEEIDTKGYNPISGKYMIDVEPEEVHSEIPSDTPFIKALEMAREKMKCSPEVKTDLKSVIKYVSIAAARLRYTTLTIAKVKRAHLKTILQECGVIKKEKWSANNHNHYRSHLSMLFNELIEWETIEYNPVEKISKEKTTKKKRETLTMEQRIIVYNTLREHNFRFWVLMNIFYLAGCRRAEIMRVQVKDVDMVNQKFKAITKKGKYYKEVEYTITDSAVPFWNMVLTGDNCLPEYYVFSRGLIPGPVTINPKQITRRWNYWIKKRFTIEKDGFEITADFYSLKHLHTTGISSQHGTEIAAAFNNESKKMIEQHYDTGLEERTHQKKKRMNFPLVTVGQ